MLLAELFQIRQPRHGPVRVLHDLAQNPRGSASSHARQVQRRLGVTRALQHATLAVAKREDVTRTHEVVLVRVRVTEIARWSRAVPRGDPGGGRLEIHADGESGLHGVLVLLAGDHEGEVETVREVVLDGDADEAAVVVCGEVNDFLGRSCRRADKVALVLAVLVVEDDDELTGGDVREGFLDGRETRGGLVGVEVVDVPVTKPEGVAATTTLSRRGARRHDAGGDRRPRAPTRGRRARRDRRPCRSRARRGRRRARERPCGRTDRRRAPGATMLALDAARACEQLAALEVA